MQSIRFDWPTSWTKALPDEGEIVCLIAAHDFPEPDLIRDVIQGAPGRDITFVARARDKHTLTAFADSGVEPVVAELNPIWKLKHEEFGYDHQARVRDSEILNRCSRVILFVTPQTKTLDEFRDPLWVDTVRVIERGDKVAKKRKKGRVIQ